MDDHQATRQESPAPARKKRRFFKAFLGLGLLSIGFVAALPWLLGTPAGRDWVINRVNARLAPGSIRLGGLGLSWTGPITLRRLALVDPKGKVVVAAGRVTLGRGLLELLTSRDDLGTIVVEDAMVDLDRRADGSTDLSDALGSVMGPAVPVPVPPMAGPIPTIPKPAPSKQAVAITIKSGTLKLASPELVEPIEAATVEGLVKIAPGQPTEISAALGGEGRSLVIKATLDAISSDRSFSVVGKAWPIHVRQSGVEAKGKFSGDLAAKQGQGLWAAQGEATLGGFEAAGPALQGDRLAFDRVFATCDVEQSSTGWGIRKLELSSPVATLQGSGTVPAIAGTPAQLKGQVDLAALAKLIPNALRLRDDLTIDRGSAKFRVDVTSEAGVDRLDLFANLDDFAAREAGREVRLRQPVFLTGKATRSSRKIEVETLEIKAAGVDVTGSGDLQAGVKLAGTVDLVGLMAQVRDIIDPGQYDLAGHARLAADYRHVQESYKGRFAVEFKDLKVSGATAEPIVRDKVRFDGWAVGPSQPDGLPADWRQARLDLNAGDLKLDVQATSESGNPSVVAGFEMAVTSPVAGRFDAKAKFRKVGTAYEVAELIAGITPTDPTTARGDVALAIQGKFDPASGEGTFGPIPGQAVGAVGLGPEGIKLSGVGKAGLPLKIDAALVGDLASLDILYATWKGSPPKGLQGLWAAQVGVSRSSLGKLDVAGKVFAPGVAIASTPRGPVSLTIQAGYAPEVDRFDLTTFDLGSQYGKLGLVGGLVETKGRRLFDLSGTIEPNWLTIDPAVVGSLGRGARVRAQAKKIHLAGMLQADSTPQMLGQIIGEIELDLTEAHAYGLTLGPAPVVLRLGQGLAKFDPIQTTLNDGSVSIIADLALDGDQGVWLRLGSSKVEGAEINQAVSDSILSYVAPVMAKSSAVSGKVTVVIDGAFVPITASGAMTLDGAMALQNVVFQPGPLASQLNSITGQAMHEIKLNEAMFIKVADGRVRQNGLSIPVGGDGLKVAIDGSVGFDESLDLRASVPLSAKALGIPAGGALADGGTMVALPIKGTLAKPAIDRKALSVALRDAARSLGEKRIKAEAGRFLDRVAGPGQSIGEPRSKPSGRNPLGDLENLGREILDPKKP